MLKNKIIDYFFKQAEIGNWDKIKLSDVEKKLNLKKNSIKKLFADQIYFKFIIFIQIWLKSITYYVKNNHVFAH